MQDDRKTAAPDRHVTMLRVRPDVWDRLSEIAGSRKVNKLICRLIDEGLEHIEDDGRGSTMRNRKIS